MGLSPYLCCCAHGYTVYIVLCFASALEVRGCAGLPLPPSLRSICRADLETLCSFAGASLNRLTFFLEDLLHANVRGIQRQGHALFVRARKSHVCAESRWSRAAPEYCKGGGLCGRVRDRNRKETAT